MFSFLDAKAAKEFGTAMARFYMTRIPLNADLKEKQDTGKSQKIIEKISVQIVNYKKTNKINTYKIAQMGNSFKWELKDSGYDDDFIDKLTQWFVTKVKTE